MYKRILVPVDGSGTSNEALEAALQMARESGSCVRVVHSLDEFVYMSAREPGGNPMQVAREQGSKVLQDAVGAARTAGVPCDAQLVDARGRRLGEVVADQARSWGADLVVVGTHGHNGPSPMLLGSGAAQVARCAPTPVLVHRTIEVPRTRAAARPPGLAQAAH